uniref:Uncharacterized protein n=1 Tax=Zea mays TaxID=4577 RepID=C0P936_MAIZE|nr:unknown [Zea mays]
MRFLPRAITTLRSPSFTSQGSWQGIRTFTLSKPLL